MQNAMNSFEAMAEKVTRALEMSRKRVERKKILEQGEKEAVDGTLRRKDKFQLGGKEPSMALRFHIRHWNIRRSFEASSMKTSSIFSNQESCSSRVEQCS